jgi:hypothetical protein
MEIRWNDNVLSFGIFEIPLFTKNKISLLPEDDFLLTNLKFSTFIPTDDDLVLLVGSSFLLFDRKGCLLHLALLDAASDLLSSLPSSLFRPWPQAKTN